MKSASSGEAPRNARTCPTCGLRFGDDALFCPNDGAPLANAPRTVSADQADPYIGTEISGHIVIKSLAGSGAMGRVYRAYQTGVERDVAVKILHRELSANAQLVQRFHREAKVASRLSHPNVVHVHLAGQLPDGALYIVMEYLDGLSLQSALAGEGGALDLSRALHIALQICDAVGEAHVQGVVHRDLKPENVMLVRRGADDDFVKVLDFGIARLNWGEQSMATAAGLIFGTARYISPEGAQGETVGPPGDVYSVATLVYQMLAGRTPFEGDQAVALLVQQIHDPPPALRSIPRAHYVPEPIANVVMRNLVKDPVAREPDARALGRALLDAAKAAGLSADELVGMPLLGGRPSSAVKLPPMQRTKQLQLDAEMQQRLAEASMPQEAPPARPSAPSAPPPDAKPGVDITLDDMEAPPLPAPTPSVPVGSRTEMSAPLPSALAPSAPSAARTQISSAPSAPSLPSEAETDDVEPPPPARRLGARAIAIFVLCFFVGVGGATAVAYKLGFIGPNGGVEHQIELAHAALAARHFDAPPGDNVLEITDEGLRRAPGDPRLIEVRREASDEVTKDAVAQWTFGSKPEGLRLMQLAADLDPNDETVKKLVAQYRSELDAGVAASRDAGVAIGPLPTLRPPPPSTFASPAGSNGPRATLDLTPAAPRLGLPVQLVAKITSSAPIKAPPEGAVFDIATPAAQVIHLPAITDASGTCSAQFTFLEQGRFVVTFNAKVDGKPVQSIRTVAVGDVPPQPSGTDASPLPSATGKWM